MRIDSGYDESEFPSGDSGFVPRGSARRGSPGLLGRIALSGLTVTIALGWFAWLSPALHGLEAERRAAVERALRAESALAAADHELARFRARAAYSEAYGIPVDLVAAIQRAAIAENLDPDLAFRLVQHESGFRQGAVSPLGAIGLTQLLPSTAGWLEPGITDAQLYDRDTNLRLGFRYLRQLLDRYDSDPRLALLAYNRGPAVVRARLSRGEDPGNGFASRVLGAAE